ncbi:MAG: cytidylate kinase-like family protein [Prolixibacteraceae bacterium]|nr:cytidylate kinase-like family protein [Prolixibacteraceae bacterium]
MNDVFYDYMSKRLNETAMENYDKEAGPIVTISRAAGCTANQIARKIAAKISASGNEQWEVINKEVLHESAKALNLKPENIKDIYKNTDRSIMDEIAQAFISNTYQLERKFRKTVIDVILRFAYEGNKIIVGRASNIICTEIKNSLHVRIDAPLEWRINNIIINKCIRKDEALTYIMNTEKNRTGFRKSIKGKKVIPEDFDITFNQAKFNETEIVDSIYNILLIKNIVKKNKP